MAVEERQYGYAFIIATAITGIGVPMFFWIERKIINERKYTAEIEAALVLEETE